MAVVDASVYVALINKNEAYHERSWAWFQQIQSTQEQIAAPAILLAEVASALGRGTNNPQLAQQAIQQMLQAKIITLAPITVKLAEQAAQIATNYKIRGCDAIYVALAQQLDDHLITLDNQQLQRGASIIVTRRP